MLLDKGIKECEIEYTNCFSKFTENDDVIRFYDTQLHDMYYHNFTGIKRSLNNKELKCVIEDEISLNLSNNIDFCTILSDFYFDSSILSSIAYKFDLSINGYYSFDISQSSRLNSLSNCIIKKVENQELLRDVLYCDLQYDEEELGKDFCERRCYRRGKVYLSDKGVNAYLCYHNGEIIGNCDLFIHNGVAKIEDFFVITKYQRRGYGTTILKELIEISLKENCHTIYLITDEEGTAKEMYQKIGFNKIGERMDLFFKL